MQMLSTIKKKPKKYIKLFLIIAFLPIMLVVVNLILNTLFNLGIYVGTFLRFVYHIIVF